MRILKITDFITVTELSRITKKTRPTIYKYISEYEKKNYDEIPFSIKILFDKIVFSDISKDEIKKYCSEKFGSSDYNDEKLKEIIEVLNENVEKLDLGEIKKIIEEKVKENEEE